MLDKQLTSLPVDDAFAVEEEEADCYLRCIKPEGEEKSGVCVCVVVVVVVGGCFIFQKTGKCFKQEMTQWSSRG